MSKLTITEALAELKTIGKRLDKKKEFVLGFLLRQEMIRDPLEKDGGSVQAVAAERQSARDLQERVLLLRRGIQTANERETITIGGTTRSIADWLVWRREVAPWQQQMLGAIRNQINATRTDAARKGFALVAATETSKPTDVLVNVSEKELAAEIENLENTLGTLDGQLSLKNATVLIDA